MPTNENRIIASIQCAEHLKPKSVRHSKNTETVADAPVRDVVTKIFSESIGQPILFAAKWSFIIRVLEAMTRLNYTRLMTNLFGPFGWCVGAAVLFGASTPLCKPLLEHVSPLFLAGCLYVGAGLATLPTSLRKKNRHQPASRDRRKLAGAVFFGGVIGPVFLLLGLSTEEAGNVSLLLNLETTATVFLGWLVFKEQTNARLWVASALIVLGGVLLNIPFLSWVHSRRVDGYS